jgi:superfamily II DNA or RNA helicase
VIDPRPYQLAAGCRVLDEFESGVRSTLVVLPTGVGKTTLFGMVARRFIDEGGRALVIAHREELIDQAADELAGLGLGPAIEQADRNARSCLWTDPDCVIGSVQTLQGKRLASWPRDHFQLIVTDEAHHAVAGSYGNIYRHFRGACHLGVTATADRLDGEDLGQVFESLAYEYSLRRAIEDGWLCRIKVVRCETSVDLSDIRTAGKDLPKGDIEDAIRPHVDSLANATRQEIGDRRAIVFTPDVGSAQAMASALTSLGLKAESIDGDTPNRDELIDGFKRGHTRIMVNCQILSEGFNAPFVSAIVLARPTMSRALYAQMVGRGTRLNPPHKKDCLVVDFAWLTDKHKLVNPAELLMKPGAVDEIASLAGSMIDGEPLDLMDAIERAEREVVEREKVRIAARERVVSYRKVEYDPFDPLGIAPRVEPQSTAAIKATEKQVATLRQFGVENPESMSRARASQMLGILIARREKGLATMKMVGLMIRKGVAPEVARSMPFADASALLDDLIGKRRVS